jgi:hypothetical protein
VTKEIKKFKILSPDGAAGQRQDWADGVAGIGRVWRRPQGSINLWPIL